MKKCGRVKKCNRRHSKPKRSGQRHCPVSWIHRSCDSNVLISRENLNMGLDSSYELYGKELECLVNMFSSRQACIELRDPLRFIHYLHTLDNAN